MKQILFAMPLLAAVSPAFAAPTYLTCKDTTHIETTRTTSDRSDEVETESNPGVYKIFLNLDQNQATVDGVSGYRLEVDPTVITISRTTSEDKPEDSRGNRTSRVANEKFSLNRATLLYNRVSSSLYQSTTDNRKAFRTSLLIMKQAGVPFFSKFDIDRKAKSTGSCVKALPPANNQI